MIIRDYLNRQYASIGPETPLSRIIDLFREKNIGVLPVIDDAGKYQGTITPLEVIDLFMPDFITLVEDVDYVRDLGALELDRQKAAKCMKIKASEIAIKSRHLLIDENSTLLGAMAIMKKDNLSHLLVVKEDRLEGLVARGDLLRAVLDYLKKSGGE